MAKKKPHRLAGRTYGKKKFSSLTAAYNRYRRDRTSVAGGGATVAPKGKFAQIWGWKK